MRKILIVIGMVIAAGLILGAPYFIKVKTECISQFGGCPGEIYGMIKNFDGKSLSVAKSGINKNLKNNSLVSDYSIQYKAPNILLVNLIVKKPFYAIHDPDSGKYASIDENGNVLSISQGSALPTLIAKVDPLDVGVNVGTEKLFALKIILGVYEMYQVREGKIIDGGLTVELPPRFNVIFPLQGDAEVLLGSLRIIYSRISQDDISGKYKEIDLRFKNPVLR